MQNSSEELGEQGEDLQRLGGGAEQFREARRTRRRLTETRRRRCRTVQRSKEQFV